MKLKVEFKTTTTNDQYYGYGVNARVVEADGIDPCIFVYHAGVPELPAKNVVDTFSHVASPVDMEEFPANEPDMSKKIPYYRRREATLWVRSADWLDEIKARIDNDIALLVRNYSLLNDENQYTDIEEKTYG